MGSEVQQALGKHEVTVTSVDIYEKAGDEVISVLVHFEDGERSSKEYYPMKSEKSLEMTRGVLRAMGYDLDSKGLDPLLANNELLAGQKLQAVVAENEWNGRVTNQIAFLNAIPKKLEKAAISRLNAALKNVKKSNRTEEL